MNVHPAAAIFPLLSGPELEALVEDIRKHGLREPIITLNGQILDGRNRYEACRRAGVAPIFCEWSNGSSPIDYVVSLNIKRRHLTVGQRAMIADELRPLFEEEARKAMSSGKANPPTDSEEGRPSTRQTAKRAADLVGLSDTRVYEAAVVNQNAPDLADEVRKGTRALYSAYRKAKPPSGKNIPSSAALLASNKSERHKALAKRRFNKGLAAVSGVCDGLKDFRLEIAIAGATETELRDWHHTIDEAVRVLSAVRRTLKEAR